MMVALQEDMIDAKKSRTLDARYLTGSQLAFTTVWKPFDPTVPTSGLASFPTASVAVQAR